MDSKTHQKMSTMMQECIQECISCHSICEQTITHCLQLGGKHADPTHIGLLRDCAQICQTSADFMLRGSELHGRTCAVCAEACELCAQSCEAMGNDAMMQQCAQSCRSCAASCREMAAM